MAPTTAGFRCSPTGGAWPQTFQDALEAVLGCRPDIKGCSRTDAGVHALGFMLNFHADTRIPVEKLPLALNQHLPAGYPGAGGAGGAGGFPCPVRGPHQRPYLYRIHNSPIDSPVRREVLYPGARGGWTRPK